MYEHKFIDDTDSLPHKQHTKHVKEKKDGLYGQRNFEADTKTSAK